MTPSLRLRVVNGAPLRPERDWVVYWMNAARRPGWNFALERAAQVAAELGKPLVVVEALSASYRWASERFSAFVLDGMADHADHFARRGAAYLPYVEPRAGAGRGLHAALGARAALYVTDEWPCGELPRWVERVGAALDVRLEAVDSCGLLPLRAAEQTFASAYAFRRFLQRELPVHLADMPAPDSLAAVHLPAAPPLPAALLERWRPYDPSTRDATLAVLPVDHAVQPTTLAGGPRAGAAWLQRFVGERLAHYDERNRIDRENASGLSPYLHFGHIGAHQALTAVAAAEGWSPAEIDEGTARGKREGWWGLSPAAEAFLDELVTWRELGHNFCRLRPDDHDRYESLPDWARTTLAEHARDPRPHQYDLEQFAAAATHDELWNAAQTQLAREGRIHNYLRMLWGKKILHWTASPQEALVVMTELNNRYALDGRDPNSYAGIGWVLGRFDRPWGPERPVFGKVRYMTCANTRRKYNVRGYLERFAPGRQPGLF